MIKRFSVTKERGGWTVWNRMEEEVQEGFESEEDANEWINETFGGNETIKERVA